MSKKRQEKLDFWKDDAWKNRGAGHKHIDFFAEATSMITFFECEILFPDTCEVWLRYGTPNLKRLCDDWRLPRSRREPGSTTLGACLDHVVQQFGAWKQLTISLPTATSTSGRQLPVCPARGILFRRDSDPTRRRRYVMRRSTLIHERSSSRIMFRPGSRDRWALRIPTLSDGPHYFINAPLWSFLFSYMG